MPNTSPSALSDSLDNFMHRFLTLYRDTDKGLPLIEFDSDWPSSCHQTSDHTPAYDGELIPWRPVLQQRQHDLFIGLTNALETPIHPDICTYYSRYWSDPILASCRGDKLSLIFVWNDDDYERLRGNLIGHTLNKRRQNIPLSLFFACTEPEDLVLTVENDTGVVLLEQPGNKKPIREVASSLAEFIDELIPIIQP